MATATTRTFRSGNSEALRLPKEMAFGEGVELTLVRSGEVLTVYRTRPSVKEMIAAMRALPGPDSVEERDVEELPEPPGL